MDLFPVLVSLLSRLLTGVGDEAKSFLHRKSDLTATLSAFIATKPYISCATVRSHEGGKATLMTLG